MACIWAWMVFGVAFGSFFVIIAAFLPPPSESASAADIAASYDAKRTSIRACLIGARCASVLPLPFVTVVSPEIRKIVGRNPLVGLPRTSGSP
jgi:hypothetical protein